MDDSWNVIIYVIIALVSLIGGLYKNASNKQEEERQRQRRRQMEIPVPQNKDIDDIPKETRPLDPFEEFIRRQLGQLEEIQEIPKPIEPVIKKPPVIKQETMSAKLEGAAVFETTKNSLISDKIIENGINQEGQIKGIAEYDYNAIAKDEIGLAVEEYDEFDPRKAVIYSEILHRKEF